MKFKMSEGWDAPVAAAEKAGKSIFVWMDHEDGKLSQWRVYPDGRKQWIRITFKR
jgi:hypothetical protein